MFLQPLDLTTALRPSLLPDEALLSVRDAVDLSMAQALMGLIPTLTSPLPPELVELAVSLLAQSRSKASNLKADEEIARSYACANLACERLKQSLALPKIEPRPPCPPNVYQKLYRYLDSALPAGTRRSARPSRHSTSTTTPHSSPAKPRTPAKATPLKPDTRQKKTPQRLSATIIEAPAWTMPVIRHLCNKMEAPAAPHHIFAGVSSILASQQQQSTIKIPALVVAVYVLVTTRLAGTETAPDEYRATRALALEIIKDATRDDETNMQVGNSDVDNCMREVKNQEWTQMDWFRNITPGLGVGLAAAAEDDADEGSGDDSANEGAFLPLTRRSLGRRGSLEQDYLQAGLGTMMRDQVDYLSDNRRLEYQAWKRKILIQIEELEKGQDINAELG
ncbi:origin recognition complex, subunit 6 [Usnea florida]